MKTGLKLSCIILVIVLLFAACAPAATTNSQPASTSPEATSGDTETTPATDAGSGEVINISFWRPAAGEAEEAFYAKVVEDFNKANEGKIVVTMDSITRGNSFAYEDKVNVAVTSHSLPDILALDGPNVSNYAYSDIVIPLNEYFSEEELSDYVPSIVQQGTYNDKLYALGGVESTVVLFYNKKILAEAGITPPETMEEAWTWDEFYEVTKKLNKEGLYGTNLINDKGEWMTYCFEQFWISNNTDIVSPDGKTAEGYVNSPEGVEAAEFIQKMANEKLFSVDPIPFEFEQGLAATRLSGPWIISDFKNYPDLDWGMTYFPYKSVKTSPSGSWAFGVSADSKNAAAAAEFIKFMTSSENCTELAKAISMPPARKSSFESIEAYQTMPYKVIADQVINMAHARPSTPNYPVLTQKYTEALLDIMMGSNAKEKLDKVASDVDKEYQMSYK